MNDNDIRFSINKLSSQKIDDEMFELNISKAKSRIRKLYNKCGNDIYLSFSGGKDSTVVLALIKMVMEEGLPIRCPAVFVDTKIELDVTKKFVLWVKNNYYKDTIIVYPNKSFAKVISEYGKPLRSKRKSEAMTYLQKNRNLKSGRYLFDNTIKRSQKLRLANKDLHFAHENFDIKVSNKCCDVLKKEPFNTYTKENNILGYFDGQRAFEGGARELNYIRKIQKGNSPCTSVAKNGTISISPIIDWNDNMIELFIERYKVPLSEAYTVYGKDRTGCFLCPYSVNLANDLYTLFKYEPSHYKAAMHWLKDVYIAQNTKLPFDTKYEYDRVIKWEESYTRMRDEMIAKYRPGAVISKKDLP